MATLTIVSRTSTLALWQAEFVREQLLQFHPKLDIQIIGIKTTGDKWLETSLQKIGGKGLFVKELEQMLLTQEADLAVHSLKDVPYELPDGLILGAICKRDNPFDAWICPQDFTPYDIPAGKVVGTSSLRRILQLKKMRPDLNYVPMRGNIDSRIEACEAGKFDAIVLAQAGLERLDYQAAANTIFTPDQLLPAVGQGALALECRANDPFTNELISVLNHIPTRNCIEAERSLNASLGGNCHVPIAAYAQYEENYLCLRARVGNVEKVTILDAQRTHMDDDPIALGEAVAQDLIDQGAQDLIAEYFHDE